MAAQFQMLEVNGASLYFEIRGSGPLLLLIPGGPQDAGVFVGLAEALADEYTTVSVDPRCNSRSVCEARDTDLDVALLASDMASIIAHLRNGPVHVFGTSGGAQIALALAANYPEGIATVIAHEPPAVMLLDDPSEALAADERVYTAYQNGGAQSAFQTFLEVSGMANGEAPPEPQSAEEAATFGRINGNMEYFFAHGMRPLTAFTPDVAKLVDGPVRIVVGAGAATEGEHTHLASLALAQRLGQEPAIFPGDHVAYTYAPEAFAEVLSAALR